MRKLFIMTCAALLAGFCLAEPKAHVFSVSMGAATGNTNTLTGVFGKIVEVQVSCADGSSTGTVALAYIPLDGINSAVNISTGEVTGVKIFRPTVDSTDIAGADLTSDTPERFYITGETLRLIVTGSPTNKTWKATIKIDR